ncbi:hypothetical protein HPP92_028482 [Vanilla planifolia]|uniref:Uncharacterized protein n=1 Tax=Vanilla planifolia TaxID=51239 RepID=A0A835U5T9_VANPL|nr:hypothetical protein HPP92_028482 [Vanilla planifolia]
MQNPSVYTAACVAASLGHLETKELFSSSHGGYCCCYSCCFASAWWATHGLLPFFPYHPCCWVYSNHCYPVVNRGQTQHDEMEGTLAFSKPSLPEMFCRKPFHKQAEVETVLKKAMQTAKKEACKMLPSSEFDHKSKVHRTGSKPYKKCSTRSQKDVDRLTL